MTDKYKKLDWSELRFTVDTSKLKFETTDDIEVEDRIYGQDRAIQAIDFGVEIKSFGYNIFVLGPVGTGKTTAIRRALKKKAQDLAPPPDWVYVNNFDDNSQPKILVFPTGKGHKFQDHMNNLIEDLKQQIPQTFEHENYQEQWKSITGEFEKERQKGLEHLAEFAAERSIEIKNMGRGFVMIPIKDGKSIQPEEFETLEESERAEIESAMNEIKEEMENIMESIQDLEEKTTERLNDLNRRIADMVVGRSIGRLKKKYSNHKEVIQYLNEVKEDILDNIKDFTPSKQPQQTLPIPMMQQDPDFNRYSVNLLVSNCEEEGAPVIFEKNPSYYNLVGRIEHKATPQGSFQTDFSLIKPGALHRANGGYLIIEATELLRSINAYDALKRCLKNKQIMIEDLNEQYRLIVTQSLRPEPVPLETKVVLIGSPYIYYMLYTYDEDFQKLFKVKADFGFEMDISDMGIEEYTHFIAAVVSREKLKPFTSSAVAAVIEHSTRMSGHQKKLTTAFSNVADILRESSYWSSRNGNGKVEKEDVVRAIEEKEYRSNKIEQKLQEYLEDGTIMVDTEGKIVGQVNGLAVMSYGDFIFGKPSRITARYFAGKAGVVNIEREVKLSGRIHDKGVMILTSFLKSKFGSKKEITFSATLTFEQVYDEVDGDSASSTELYALLSALSDVPLNQSIAVTGSVNQYGQIQPIGGANHKIEGFFALCKARGLTGKQGVMIPHQNVKNLALKEEVIEAAKEGKFNIWSVTTIEEGIEILTDKPAGELQDDGTYPEDSIYRKVFDKLKSLSEAQESGNKKRSLPRSKGIKF